MLGRSAGLKQRGQKAFGSRRPGDLEPDRASVRLDPQSEAQKSAAAALRLDHRRRVVEQPWVGVEPPSKAPGNGLPALGPDHQAGQEPVAHGRDLARGQATGDRGV